MPPRPWKVNAAGKMSKIILPFNGYQRYTLAPFSTPAPEARDVNNQTWTYEIAIRDIQIIEGRNRYEASLVSEDGQTLYIYEGQLKEVDIELELGGRYLVQFRPFVNNRWLELKIVAIQAKMEG